MRYKKQAFLYGIATGEFAAYRTYGHMLAIDETAQKLNTETRREDSLVYRYAEIVTLTVHLNFDWEKYPDIPEEFYALETWWEMRKSGASEVEAFKYYTDNVPHNITTLLSDAIAEALKMWTPPETAPESELTEEQLADPN